MKAWKEGVKDEDVRWKYGVPPDGNASRAVNISLTLRNWFIGYYIAEFELQGADRANYGDKLLTELAKALRAQAVSNSGRRQLYGYLAFYRTYPQIVRTTSALSAQVMPRQLLEQKVRTVSAPSSTIAGTDPETLIARLSFATWNNWWNWATP